MSKDTPSHINTHREEHSSSTLPTSPGITFSSSDIQQFCTPQKSKRKTEAQKLEHDIITSLNLDSNILHSGSRLLRSQKTLYIADEEKKIKEVERNRLIDEEIVLRPLRPGQGVYDERFLPKRDDFEYIYRHIDELDCQVWASNVETWLHFITQHELYPDPSLPVFDKEGQEYPDARFSLDSLLSLPSNKKYLKKKRKKNTYDPKRSSLSDPPSSKDLSNPPPNDSSSSSSSTGSFVILPHQNITPLIDHPIDLHAHPPSTGVTPTTTPQATPPSTPSEPSRSPTPTRDSDSDSHMASLKERSVFFPPDKFDGTNEALTKQHWQIFEDFCNQQKLYIDDLDETRAAARIDQILPFFKMTLIKLARAWADRQTFTTAKELKEKFLTDFSPYGKTHRQWIASWAELKFNPDSDNIDEFIEKFEDLATLNNLKDDYKLHAFKIAMPREVELHLRSVTNLQDCYQTAKDLLTIVQSTVTNKMSTLSLAQSRSPSPQTRSRSPSPKSGRTTPSSFDRSRPRIRQAFEGFRQYPGPTRPQSILKRPYINTKSRGGGRQFNRQRSFNRPRSLSRNRGPPVRCFNCNMIGHFARNCFTRTRSQSRDRNNFPRRFTPNPRRNQRQIQQRYQQPRVRFQDQNINRYNKGYQNQNRNPNPYNTGNRYFGQNPNYQQGYNTTNEYTQEIDDYQDPTSYDLNQ